MISQRLNVLPRGFHRRYLLKKTRGFSTREESVEAVFLFHRHGDRTPGKSLVAEDYRDEESEFWKSVIPPTALYEMLSERFPVIRHQNNNDGQFKDASGGNESYGFLTWKGMHQMYHNGKAMAARYSKKGDQHFQDHWDITAVSTNYLRTVKSCQTFLDGLLGSSLNLRKANYEYPTHYESIDLEHYQNTQEGGGVKISIRDIKNETLNAFDSSPELMKTFVKDVIATPEFTEKDSKAVSLAARLSHFIPGLMKHSPYGGSTQSGISWMYAADHFICRTSHSVPLTQFSHRQDDPSAEKTLQAMSHATIAHLSSRFRSWYHHPSLLGEMAGPALNDIQLEMRKIIEGQKSKNTFNLYSCHDVTLLAILYAVRLGGLFSSEESLTNGLNTSLIDLKEEDRFTRWPNYATCLTFELIRVREPEKEDEFIVKLWMNEPPIPELNIVSIPVTTSLSQHKGDMTISDFEGLVYNINKARAN